MVTKKHKKKRLEYVHQYQTLSAEEQPKVVFSDEKTFNLDDFRRELLNKAYDQGWGFSYLEKLKL